MNNLPENKICYFCDEPYPHPSCFIDNINEIWVCHSCEFIVSKNNIQENGECCICYENKILIKLPSCTHKLCLECCKNVYFGFATTKKPIHWREFMDNEPIFPYELNDDDENDPERIKYEEYVDFEHINFNYEEKTYDELIEIRNNLIIERPDWMNTEVFINYENDFFRYNIRLIKIEKEWNDYNENKIIGNSICPLCRKEPL